MNLDERAIRLLEKRVLVRDSAGKLIETPEQMFSRISTFLGENKNEDRTFKEIMENLEFLPNSPCLVNAGVEGRDPQLSACFVLSIDDSINSIMDTMKEAALIHKSGGGTGFSFSRIRPKDAIVHSTSGVASGPLPFMKSFDGTTEAVKQGGYRRGANMGVLRVDHPDIEEFINSKRGTGALQNFNISVGITDEFMEALLNNRDYELKHPKSGPPVIKKAKVIWDQIISNAHHSGEPGVLFIDRISKHNPLSGKESEIEATNPCGEQPLAPNEACGLGSINLSTMVNDYGLNVERLREVTKASVIFLNRMLDKSKYPNTKVHKRVHASRKIGLGIMGWADMLIKLKIPYESQDALTLAEKVIQIILDEAVKTTHELGQRDGVFDLFKNYVPPTHIKESLKRLKIPLKSFKPRNSALLTIAPTGSISMIAGASSGIEPIFLEKQEENRMDEVNTYEHALFAEFRKKFPGVKLPGYFQTMWEVSPNTHVEMQATFQKYICSGVSKTVNLPNEAPISQVHEAYMNAYMLGCKGVTVYRDGSLENQVIGAIGKTTKTPMGTIQPMKRPEVLSGKTYEIRTGFGPMLTTINYHAGVPFEVICQLGKSGASEQAKAEAISRLVSMLLRCNVDISVIINQLDGIVGDASVHTPLGLVKSIPDAVAKILMVEVDGIGNDITEIRTMVKCPDCNGQSFTKEGSCLTCQKCGWKSCG